MKFIFLVLCLSCTLIVSAQNTPISTGVKVVNDENTWQHVLKQYRGRTVVICYMAFNQKRLVLENIEKIRAAEKKLTGKKVVFLKCIQQSNRKDKAEYFQEYVGAFTDQGMLDDVYYVENTLSLHAMAEDATEGHWGIYNAEGLIHHPTPRKIDLSKSFNDQVPATTLLQELDTVLMGRGHYYERNADYFLRYTSLKKFASNDGNYKEWTLGYTSGPYLTYYAGDPKQPMYGREEDSLYQQMKFIESKIYMEDSLVLRKGAENPKQFRYDYSAEPFWGTKKYSYVLDKKKNIITINDEKGKLYKRLRIVLITLDMLVVEAI
jgi:hypothetical protein